MRTRLMWLAVLAIGGCAVTVALPSIARAQAMDLKATPPARERIAPAVPERDLYPQRPSLPDRPHFFGSLSRDTGTGRAGIAGFSVPNAPVGSRVAGQPDNPGWAGVGFAIEWGRSERVD
ncbi:MAG TPA: hypothetical protein VIA61_13065 [Methylomirabilota bacterium]